MPTRDQFLSFAKRIKGEMDSQFIGTLKTTGITEDDLNQDDGRHSLKTAMQDLGFKIFPSLDQARLDGFVRVIRAGSVLGAIVSNLETPGPGSDRDLARLLNELKHRYPENE